MSGKKRREMVNSRIQKREERRGIKRREERNQEKRGEESKRREERNQREDRRGIKEKIVHKQHPQERFETGQKIVETVLSVRGEEL